MKSKILYCAVNFDGTDKEIMKRIHAMMEHALNLKKRMALPNCMDSDDGWDYEVRIEDEDDAALINFIKEN